MRRIISRLKKNTGETIAEALVAVLIMELVFVFLANAVVTSAGINAKARNTDVSFEVNGSSVAGSYSAVIKHNETQVNSTAVNLYYTGNDADSGYYYYEVQ